MLRRPFVFGSASVTLGGSVGVGVYPDDGTSADRFLALADDQMNEVKKAAGRKFIRG